MIGGYRNNFSHQGLPRGIEEVVGWVVIGIFEVGKVKMGPSELIIREVRWGLKLDVTKFVDEKKGVTECDRKRALDH